MTALVFIAIANAWFMAGTLTDRPTWMTCYVMGLINLMAGCFFYLKTHGVTP